MKEWNRKQKAISFISGLIGFVGGFQLGVLQEPLIFIAVGTLAGLTFFGSLWYGEYIIW